MKIPITLGKKIDNLYELRSERLDAERAIDAMKAKESLLKEAILAHLTSEKAQRASGKLATASANLRVVGKVQDWTAVWNWAREADAPDIFQRRLNNKGWLDRVEDGAKIPGIERDTVIELSITKTS